MESPTNLNLQRLNSKRAKTDRDSQESQEQFRIVITKEANEHLENALEKINKNFEGGEVTRSDLAVYLFANLSKVLSDADIKQLRSQHFDEKRALSAMLKPSGDLPEDIRRALREHYGVLEKERKRSNRASADFSTDLSVDSPKTA